MAKETCDLYVKRTVDGLEWPAVRVTADPLDTAALLDHLEESARSLDRRGPGAGWLDGYSMRVVPIAHSWDAFVVQGRSR